MYKLTLSTIFLLGLFYVISPGPAKIENFPPISDSLKSGESGDTTEYPNVAAFYSELNRRQITDYFRDVYRRQFLFGWISPPVNLNYSPQDTSKYIRNYYISTTFLEEYVYPLHGSVFVNGYEPYVENEILGIPHGPLGDRMGVGTKFFASKATIRLYQNYWYQRVIVYFGICFFTYFIYKLWKKAVLQDL